MSREKKFSEKEVMALISAIEPVYDTLFGNVNNKISFDEKEKIWDEVTKKVNAVRGDVERTKNKIKDKWGYLKSEAKLKLQKYHEEQISTDSGDPPAPVSEKYLRIVNMLPAEAVNGLQGLKK